MSPFRHEYTALLRSRFLNTPLEDWLTALAAAIVTFLLLHVLRRLIRGRLGELMSRLPGRFDDVAVDTLRETHGWFLLVVALYIGSHWLALRKAHEQRIDLVMGVLAIVQVALWTQSILRASIDLWTPSDATGRAGTANVAFKFLSGFLVWTLAVLVMLERAGFDIGTLLTGLGVGGVAAALALQTVLGDLFASLTIFTDRPFDIGDFIVINDFSGTVSQIGLRSTRLISLSGEQLIVPNGELMKSRIRNYRRMHERRIVNRLSIEYTTDPDKVAKISDALREIIKSFPDVRLDRVHFAEYGESGLVFELVYYVLSRDYAAYAALQEKLNLAILLRFQQDGVRFALPTRKLLVQRDASAHAQPADALGTVLNEAQR